MDKFDVIVIGAGAGENVVNDALAEGCKGCPDRKRAAGRDVPEQRLHTFQDAHLPGGRDQDRAGCESRRRHSDGEAGLPVHHGPYAGICQGGRAGVGRAAFETVKNLTMIRETAEFVRRSHARGRRQDHHRAEDRHRHGRPAAGAAYPGPERGGIPGQHHAARPEQGAGEPDHHRRRLHRL